jgi:putative tricarboxylic transport membrane protein
LSEGSYDFLYERPITLGLLSLAALTVLAPVFSAWRKRRAARKAAGQA